LDLTPADQSSIIQAFSGTRPTADAAGDVRLSSLKTSLLLIMAPAVSLAGAEVAFLAAETCHRTRAGGGASRD